MNGIQLSKIVLVEDDPDIREVATLTLETIGGFTVRAFSSGMDAVREVPGFEPDLIILDVMMPGISGPETLLALREIDALRDIPVIFMTAKAQVDEVKRFIDLGAAAVIKKPFDPMQLSEQITEIWQQEASRLRD